jgi:hypothetical protein
VTQPSPLPIAAIRHANFADSDSLYAKGSEPILSAMHAGFVWPRRIKSNYCRSERSQCLATSRCIWRCLEVLSLGLSLVP